MLAGAVTRLGTHRCIKVRLENAEVAQRCETPTASLRGLGLAGQKHSSVQLNEQIR